MKCYTFLFHCQSLIRVSKGSKIKRGKFQKEKTERTMKYRIMNMNNPNPTITAMNNEYYDLQYIKAIPIADRKSTRLNSSHANISYAVFCLKKKKNKNTEIQQ